MIRPSVGIRRFNFCRSLCGHKTERSSVQIRACLLRAVITTHQRLKKKKKKGSCLVPASVGAYFVGIWKPSWSWNERNSTLPKYTQHKLFLPCDQSENQNHFILPKCSYSPWRKTYRRSHILWLPQQIWPKFFLPLHCTFHQLNFHPWCFFFSCSSHAPL